MVVVVEAKTALGCVVESTPCTPEQMTPGMRESLHQFCAEGEIRARLLSGGPPAWTYWLAGLVAWACIGWVVYAVAVAVAAMRLD